MAELGLAIVPLCLAAIKASCVLGPKFSRLIHHDREAKRLRKELKRETQIFKMECQSLLEELIDPEEASIMVADISHDKWGSAELDTQIKDYMGSRYESLCEEAQIIKDCVSELDAELEGRYGNLSDNGNFMSVSAIREALHMRRHESSHKSVLKDLEDANRHFERLRKFASESQGRSQKFSLLTSSKQKCPPEFTLVSQHSTSFYAGLRQFWSCFQAQHMRHEVRLLLQSVDGGSLRMFMRYHAQESSRSQFGLVDFVVRTHSLQVQHLSVSAPMVTPEISRQTKKPRQLGISALGVTQFRGVPETNSNSQQRNVTVSTSTSLNLCSGGDMCTRLRHQSQHIHSNIDEPLLGYLDAPDNLRHHLSPACHPHDHIDTGRLGDPVPLAAILERPVEEALNLAEQIRLAANLVKGVLQFHSTPWLQELWRLEDLSYFNTEENLAESLRTLHITNEIKEPFPAPPPTSSDLAQNHGGETRTHNSSLVGTHTVQNSTAQEGGNDLDSSLEDTGLNHGIRNFYLHSLGLALLKIGRWDKDLDHHDLGRVRRLGGYVKNKNRRLHPPTSGLCERYQEVVERCLTCDFGLEKLETDLRQPELAAAVYFKGVRVLEDIARNSERCHSRSGPATATEQSVVNAKGKRKASEYQGW